MRDNGTDLPLMREAVRSILRLASAPVWSDYIIGPADPSQPTLSSSDEEIDMFIRSNARSAYHVVGTSSMSKEGAKTGVVDPNLLLKNAGGVRIVDASVLVRYFYIIVSWDSIANIRFAVSSAFCSCRAYTGIDVCAC